MTNNTPDNRTDRSKEDIHKTLEALKAPYITVRSCDDEEAAFYQRQVAWNKAIDEAINVLDDE
jgi:hypothetical protein